MRVLVPTALNADRCEAHEYSRCLRSQRGSLQHKRGVWVWVWGRFSRATSWSQLAAPTLHTPLGELSPLSDKQDPGGLPRVQPQVADCKLRMRSLQEEEEERHWGLNSVRASPHCS